MSPESFVSGAVSTPEQSTSYSHARVSSIQSAETIDLVTPNLIQGTPPTAACYAPKLCVLFISVFISLERSTKVYSSFS